MSRHIAWAKGRLSVGSLLAGITIATGWTGRNGPAGDLAAWLSSSRLRLIHAHRILNTHAVIPYTVLEAVRAADLVSISEEYGDSDEISTVRLGRSPTVSAQIEKYKTLARRGARVDPVEVGGIIKLIGRRRDADLVMAEAGRRAGEYAAEWFVGKTSRALLRVAPGSLKRRLGAKIVKRTALAVFEVELDVNQGASWHDSENLDGAAGDARPCEVVRAATAELLRRLTSFDGALFHVSCRKQGDDRCAWSTNPND